MGHVSSIFSLSQYCYFSCIWHWQRSLEPPNLPPCILYDCVSVTTSVCVCGCVSRCGGLCFCVLFRASGEKEEEEKNTFLHDVLINGLLCFSTRARSFNRWVPPSCLCSPLSPLHRTPHQCCVTGPGSCAHLFQLSVGDHFILLLIPLDCVKNQLFFLLNSPLSFVFPWNAP